MDTLSEHTAEISKDINIEIERLINEYGNDVLKIAMMYLKNKDKAEDAFQDVFVKVYKNYHKFKGQSSEKTWLISITANVCKDMLKSSWFKKVLLFDAREEDDDRYYIDNEVIKTIENKQLFEEVTNLPIKYREPIILYYYQEMSTIEISKALNTPEGTIRTRLHRGRELLKQNMSGRIEYDG